MIIPPAADYATSRRELLALAEGRGAALSSHRHPLAGPSGEVLATDVARFGAAPGAAGAVVVVQSGLHGVEGHAGWGLQKLLVESDRLDALPAGVAVVLVHAANPYGMAWTRRVDHGNIDVNRNFIDFGAALPRNAHHRTVASILNPRDPELDLDDRTWVDRLWAFATEVGPVDALRAITGGQYEDPVAMQFGGHGPSWSRRTLEAIWAEHLAGARLVVHLDIHTGLGPCGNLTMFQTADEGDDAAEAAARWFPIVLRFDRPQTSDPLQVGVLGPGLDARVPAGTLTVPVVVEFGTHEESIVLGALRADNWLHAHGSPVTEAGERIRSRTLDAFFVDDEGWRTSVAEQGLGVIHAALDAAADTTSP